MASFKSLKAVVTIYQKRRLKTSQLFHYLCILNLKQNVLFGLFILVTSRDVLLAMLNRPRSLYCYNSEGCLRHVLCNLSGQIMTEPVLKMNTTLRLFFVFFQNVIVLYNENRACPLPSILHFLSFKSLLKPNDENCNHPLPQSISLTYRMGWEQQVSHNKSPHSGKMT